MITTTSPENAAALIALKTIVLAIPIGAVATYEQLSDAIGEDVRNKRWLINRAIRDAEEETGGLFETVRRQGIQRLESASMPDVGLAAIRKARGAARRGFDRLGTVRVNDLSPAEGTRIIAHRSQLGAISMIADGRKSASLTAEAAKLGQPIPAGRVLEIFGRQPTADE